MSNKTTSGGIGARIKESIRKSLVSLKRSPQNIPLVALAAAFLVYSLNLSSIANTTARINGANMGQCEFAAMLFSILAFVVFLRAFPRRKPVSKLMLGLLSGMLAILVGVDAVYLTRIVSAVTRAENPIIIDQSSLYISTARTVVTIHIICICLTAVLLILLPFYANLIRKINTSIDLEEGSNMTALDAVE
ncbi:MAG: hypothetical protein II916_03200 [Oscillospiraceae bacterium]|nr:hypothetical protein [Oscillospiraceae bacterium]